MNKVLANFNSDQDKSKHVLCQFHWTFFLTGNEFLQVLRYYYFIEIEGGSTCSM
jgi:hypothetical protein